MNKKTASLQEQQMGIAEKMLKLSEIDMSYVENRIEQAVLEEQQLQTTLLTAKNTPED